MGQIERRKFPRLSLAVEVEYKALTQEEAALSKTKTKNISAGGIRIILLEQLDVETHLELKFLLPGLDKAIIATGRIVWTEEFIVGDTYDNKAYDAGVEFTDISDDDRNKIKEYVVERL